MLAHEVPFINDISLRFIDPVPSLCTLSSCLDRVYEQQTETETR